MYEAYFNLRVKPFELVPDPNFIFLSKSHKKARIYLNYGITEKAGFILLTGDIGSGKTTLIRDLLQTHGDSIVLAKLFNTSVNSDQLLAMINDDFGLAITGKDKINLLRDLNDFLVEQFAHGKQPVLIIDEAQNLSAELLEEIRMLSNLETSNSKLLQIILVGQPELRTMLARPELLQLRQRISINCNLNGLGKDEVEQYILHRLTIAGNRTAVTFQPDTFPVIYTHSRGIPRLINIICDFLMLAAFSEECNVITHDLVTEVIQDLDFDNHFWSVSSPGEITTPQPNHQQLPDTAASQNNQLLQELLQTVVQRIDAIEHADTPTQADNHEHQENLALLHRAIESNRAYTDAQLKELGNRLENIITKVDREAALIEQVSSPKAGIVRRLLGFSGQE